MNNKYESLGIVCLWLLLGYFILFRDINNPDIWTHLITGNDIYNSGFTFINKSTLISFGEEYTPHSWMMCLFFYLSII